MLVGSRLGGVGPASGGSFTVKPPRGRERSQLEEVQSGISYKSSLLQPERESPHTSTVPNSGESRGGVGAG